MHALCITHLLTAAGSTAQHQVSQTFDAATSQATMLLQACLNSLRMQSGKPFLGICLGLQLMFEGSTESGGVEGLGIVPGAVSEFDRLKGLPVPHIGWNSLQER